MHDNGIRWEEARKQWEEGHGVLDPDVLENWYTQEEIAEVLTRQRWKEKSEGLERVRSGIEK
jgi:hypothetical protein